MVESSDFLQLLARQKKVHQWLSEFVTQYWFSMFLQSRQRVVRNLAGRDRWIQYQRCSDNPCGLASVSSRDGAWIAGIHQSVDIDVVVEALLKDC